MMSKKTMVAKIAEYEEIVAREKEIKALRERLESELKSEMERRDVVELEVGNRIVRYTPYSQMRFDSTGFRKAEPDIYQAWLREVKGRRFSVA